MSNAGAILAASARLGQPPLLLIAGSDQDTRLSLGSEAIQATGSSDLHLLIEESIPYYLMHVTKNFFKQAPSRPNLLPFRTALNLVTDPDQNPKVLANVQKLLRGFRGSIVNRPEAVLRSTRDQVARRLEGIPGLHVPKVLRLHNPKPGAASLAVQRAGLKFPLIVRIAGTHTGRIVGIVEGPEQLDTACVGQGDFNLIEFFDFKSEDGVYRKYRVFFIGRRRIFRHLIAADNWNLHARERFEFMKHDRALVAEEERLLCRSEGNFSQPVDAALNAVRERTPLDFFGVDFGIARDGKVVLFEANATMSFFPVRNEPPFEHIKAVIPPAHSAFAELLNPDRQPAG